MTITSTALFAAQEPPSARGFSADSVHQFGSVDNINIFNGNLTITVPLGPGYTAGDRLSYRFTLVYNSSIWDYEDRCGINTTTTHWFSPIRGNGTDTDLANCSTEAIPNRSSNAGVGWIVTLGMLEDSATYIASDGGSHTFYTVNHPNGDIHTANVLYTRDGSYLRLRRVSNTTRVVDFPDGVKQEFECGGKDDFTDKTHCGSAPNREKQQFRLRKMSDPFGNELTIDYGNEPAGVAGATWRWTVKEKVEGHFVTEHYIDFKYNHIPGSHDHAAPYKWIIDKILLAAPPSSHTPGNEVYEARKGEYKFNYMFQKIPRPHTHDSSKDFTQVQNFNKEGVYAPLLTSVTTPAGNWNFGYYEPPASEIETGFYGRYFWTSNRAWLLDELRLPTGGGYRYEHGGYRYPRRDCVETPKMEFRKTFFTTGVRKRWEIGADGNTRGEPWLYFPNSDWPGGDDGIAYCDPSTEFRNLVVDPLGNATEHYFSIYVNNMPLAGWDARDYGLPITRRIADPLNPHLPNDQRWLSSRVYQCDAGTFDSSKVDGLTLMSRVRRPGDTAECGAPVKETYVRYDYSGLACSEDAEWGPGCTHVNRRLASERTVHHVVDDDFKGTSAIDSWTSVLNTEFDGFGHFRQSKTDGNFGIRNFPSKGYPAGDVKVTRTNYNPGVTYNPTTFAVTPFPAVDAPWILNTYDEISSWEENTSYDTSTNPPTVRTFPAPAGTKSVAKFYFDANTGRLTRTDRWAGANEGSHDVRVLFSRETAGSDRVVIKEKYFGGDLQDVSGSGWQSNPDYVIAKTLRFGSLEKLEYLNCSDSPLATIESNEIDPNTGVALTSTDISGVRTAYGYDDGSRVTRVQHGTDAAMVYQYTFQTGSTDCTVSYTDPPYLAKAPRCSKVRVTSEASGTPPESWIFHDHLGRTAVEQRLRPTGWSYKQKTFWPNGLLASESTEGADGGTIHATKYQRYDALGRPTYVVHADSGGGEGRRTEYEYEGVRITSKTLRGLARKSESSGTAMNSSVTSLQYDAQGRLVKVTEPSAGTTNAPVHYIYDVNGRIRTVDAESQKRFFEYDNRGFLLSETHPELKTETTGQSEPVAAWTGSVQYGEYDSRGNHRQTYFNTVNSRTPFDLTMSYDNIERLQTVTAAKSGDELKVFEYYPSSAAAGSREQRKTATRFNTVGKETRKVVDTFAYNGNGRLASRTMAVDDSLSMTGSFTYDSLGQLQTTTYPQITGHCAGCQAFPAARPVTNNYTYDLLQSVTEPGRTFASMTYHPNGTINEINYANAVKMVHGLDYWNLPRVNSITTIGAIGGSFDSGEYKYDGAGNVHEIGTDVFWYDGVGRLLSAKTSGVTQSFSYDRHGNITSFAGTALSVETSTNRLKASSGTVAKYDGAGNLRLWSDPRAPQKIYSYEFDALSTMMRVTGPGVGRVYVYDADDERVGVLDYIAGTDWVKETWSFRGVHNQVLRDFVKLKSGWRWKDYIYRGSLPVATVELSGGELTRYLHLDHLGSTRLATDPGKNAVDSMKFFAFGRELSQTAIHAERRQYAGHERDDDGDLAPWGDIDYMHARYYSMLTGRFLSTDPSTKDVNALQPQTWNKYAYVQNNPISKNDPDGEAGTLITAAGGALSGAAFQIGINLIAGEDWDKDVLKEMAIGAGLGLTGVGIVKVFDKGIDAYRTAKIVSAARKADAALDGAHAGRTVLGHYPAYVKLADATNARRFNIPTKIWEKMTDTQRWAANQKFLDRAIARGDDIILATPINKVKAGSYFEKELKYLMSKGYKLSDDGTRLVN